MAIILFACGLLVVISYALSFVDDPYYDDEIDDHPRNQSPPNN